MKLNFKATALMALFALLTINGWAQSALLPVSNVSPPEELYATPSRKIHPAVQPVVMDTALRDSLLFRKLPAKAWQSRNWFYRKLFLQHLAEIKSDDFTVNFDFLPDMWIGKQGDRTIWNNTREVAVEGYIGKQFSFNATVTENQGKYALYYDKYIRQHNVIPGQGSAAKAYGDGGFDFSGSSAVVSYTPSKYLNFQMGYGKNFIGNGYRSLLLSDFAFNYPYFKITAFLGNVQYTAMWAQFEDLYDATYDDKTPFPKKYGVFHFLDWNISKKLTLGLFENVMWAPRGGEWSYAIPILFLRPAEYNNGSPDKVLMGLNGSYKVSPHLLAYGQVAVNEFTLKEVFSGKGYWANKHGGQLGLRAFSLFGVPNLNATAEYNAVRPYTYSASEHIKNYGHYNEPLAHPFGANFREWLAIADYNYKRWQIRGQANVAVYGLDEEGKNYGKNIYLDYTTRVSDYGVHIGNGVRTTLFYSNTTFSYLLNPVNNLRLELGLTYRKERNDELHSTDRFVTFGLRSSFKNLYRDF